MKKRSLFAAAALLAAALVGCSTAATLEPTTEATDAPEPTEEATQEATPVPDGEDNLPEGYTLYRNEAAGFAIGYPEDWFVTETSASIVYLTSFDMEDAPDTEGIPEGETKVDLLVSQPPRAESVDAFVEDQREENEAIDTEITNVEELTVLNGMEAVLLTSEGRTGTSQTFYTVYNGYSILMSPFGDSGPFNTMIGTLRPLDGQQAFPYPDRVIEAVAEAMPDANAENITITSAERVEWNNACLELAEEDEMCAEVITPGWRVMVDADGTPVEVHTDENAEQIRIGE